MEVVGSGSRSTMFAPLPEPATLCLAVSDSRKRPRGDSIDTDVEQASSSSVSAFPARELLVHLSRGYLELKAESQHRSTNENVVLRLAECFPLLWV